MAHFKIVDVQFSDAHRYEEDLMTSDVWVAEATFICRWNSKSKEERKHNMCFTLYQQVEVQEGENSCKTRWHPLLEYFLDERRDYRQWNGSSLSL